MSEPAYRHVNLDDPRQDVHRAREHPENLARYAVAEALLPKPAEGLRVLELGGGIGALSRRLRKRGLEVTFADLSEHNVARAIEAGFESQRLDLNEGLAPFAEYAFDGVVILEVIEHIVAVEHVLREINRVLKPGGFVILSTPNFSFFLNRLRILFGGLSHDEGYHYRFFNPGILKQRLAQADLSLEATHHTAPAFGYNFFANRLLGRPRRHWRVPAPLAGLLAHTLFVRATKPKP